MSKFAGVEEYVQAELSIYFEPNHIACDYCPLLETYARKQCRMTGEYLLDTRVTGTWCPLYFHNKENEQ